MHNVLGNGFQEVIYQRCLAIDLETAIVAFMREVEQTIYYEGDDVGTRMADFVVEEKIMVELKALINLKDVHLIKLSDLQEFITCYNSSNRHKRVECACRLR